MPSLKVRDEFDRIVIGAVIVQRNSELNSAYAGAAVHMEFFQVETVHAVGKVEFVFISGHDVALGIAYVKVGNIMIPVAGVGEIAFFYPD